MERSGGWKLSGDFATKLLASLGDRLAEKIASWDPELATQVDRDNLADRLREVAEKFADASRKSEAARSDASALAAQIERDKSAAGILFKKHEAKNPAVDDAMLAEFGAGLEADIARLPVLEQQATDAEQLTATLKEVLDVVQQRLASFDAKAAQAIQRLEQARADQERGDLILQQQQDLARLRGGGAVSTGLSALDRVAERTRVSADATNLLVATGQVPLERRKTIDEARRLAAGGAERDAESPAERLKRLSLTTS